MTSKKNKSKGSFRLIIKVSLCLIYAVVALLIAYCAYNLFLQEKKPVKWENVTSVEEYSFVTIDKMSEKFATTGKKDIHFIIDEEDKTGLWHVYLLAIDQKDYKKYKSMIDYSYDRIEKKPKEIKVYGYPVPISEKLKELTIKNYKKFVSFENQVELTLENFEEYLTNTYLDTTKKEVKNFNWIVVILMSLDLILIILIIVTILDRDKIVDEVDKMVIEEEKKYKRKKNAKRDSK